MNLSESSASDLSLSLTQSELEEDLPDGVAPEKSATSGGSADHSRRSPESSLHCDGSDNTPQLNCESSAPAVTLERYCMYDFCTLLSCVCLSDCFMAHALLKICTVPSDTFSRLNAKQAEKGECSA